MKVLIENEAGSKVKHLYDEMTFKLMSTRKLQRAYPFPYGFVIGTNFERKHRGAMSGLPAH